MFKVAGKGLAVLYPDEFATLDLAIAYCQARPMELPFTIYQVIKIVQVGSVSVTDPS